MALTLMIVDDDPQLIRVLSMFFDLEGYNVVRAANGREALTLLGEYTPDLILLDLMMPEVGGEEVVKQVRAQQKHQRIPIVIFTAAETREEELRAAGADAFITKPFSLDGLRDVIHEAIRQSSPT
jgi:two-component system OmpR family response regulator